MSKRFEIRRTEGNPAYGDKRCMWQVVRVDLDAEGEFVSEEWIATVRTKSEAERVACLGVS